MFKKLFFVFLSFFINLSFSNDDMTCDDFKLSYIKADQLLGILKSMGYNVIEFEAIESESFSDLIFEPSDVIQKPLSIIKFPNTVIVVVNSVLDNILIVTLVALYRIAEPIAANAAKPTTSKPGRRIISAPKNPTAQATQVFLPALSPSTKTAARIVKSALVNCNA